MEPYISKAALVAEIERLITELVEEGENTMFEQGRISAFEDIKVFINHTLEMEEVDLEQEIQQHINDCLDIKFPTTDIKAIAKDVEYTARKFFELGLKVKAEINKPVNDQGTTPLTIHVPPKFGQGTLSRPAYKNGCFYHQNFISDKEFLDRAIDFIVDREEGNDYICEQLHNIPGEFKFCAEDCQNLDHWCILRFLKHYKIKHLYESKP